MTQSKSFDDDDEKEENNVSIIDFYAFDMH